MKRSFTRLRRRTAPTPRLPQSTASDAGLDTPPAPPPCLEGQRVGPPDFVGVGVQRCGTTRWFSLIAEHPEIARAGAAKELHYFDRYCLEPFGDADVEGYHAHFPRSPGITVGEWTPLYMSAPWVPPLLARAAPQARLLVLLRDPLERYVSGLELDRRVAERRGAPLSRHAPLAAFLRGLYHQQLARLLAHFPRERMLILQYERCTAEPREQLRRTFEFIGVNDPEFVPALDAHPREQTGKPVLEAAVRESYVAAYADDVAALAAEFPADVDLRLWPNFAHMAS